MVEGAQLSLRRYAANQNPSRL